MKAFHVQLILSLALVSTAAFGQQGKAPAGVTDINSVRRIAPVYPYDLLLQGKTGSAEVQFTVDYSGRAMLVRKVEATDEAFAKALMADIEQNEFMPPRINGEPRLAVTRKRMTFSADASLDSVSKAVLAELRKAKGNIVPAKELDKAPFPVGQNPPNFPYALQSDGLSGKAEIEFIVDRDGRVLFPRIVSATHEDFGWAAASAVSRWRYQAPVKDGKKVDARLSVVMTFDSTTLAATW